MSNRTARPVIFAALIPGFLLGGAAAWGLHRHSTGTGAPSVPPPLSGQSAAQGTVNGDLTAAWQSLLTTGGGQGIASRLLQADLVSRATTQDIPRLLELAGKDQTAREMLLRRWAETDPSGAAHWLEPLLKGGEFPGPEGRENDIDIVFSTWAKTDPASALAKLKAASPLDTGLHRTGSLVTRLLNEDPAAGVRLGALTGSSMDLTQTYYRPSGVKWVERDPAQAAALLSALPAGEFRDHQLISTIRALAKTDLESAISLQKQFPQVAAEAWHRSERDDFYKAWAEKNPEAVKAFLKDQAPEVTHSAIKAALAQAMAAKDPVGALDWAAANVSGSDRTETVEKILSGLTKTNPDAALAWLGTLSEGTALSSAVKTFTDSLPDADAASLLSRAEALPEGAARQAVTAKAYEKMYDKDPEGMIQSLAAQPASSLPEGLWHQLGETTGDLNAGLNRLAQLPPEAAPDFVRGMFERNIDWDDSTKFIKAMESLTDPAQRTAAMDGALPKLLLNYSGQITAWAKTLPPADRSAVADQLGKNLYGLTETQRNELITPLR